MKKFLSICLVALCSVSAMYAQEITYDEATQNGVECGSTVKVSATSVNKHFNFVQWEIQKTDGSTIATITPGSSNATYNASSSQTTTDNDGKETNILTVNPLDHNLIDLVNTPGTPGTITFEAIFTEEDWYTINATTEADASIGTVSQTPNDGKVYHDETATLTANAVDACHEFLRWEDEDGNFVSSNASITINPKDYTWENHSTHTYKAVFAKKKVNIKVKTDNTKGTVAIVPASEGN